MTTILFRVLLLMAVFLLSACSTLSVHKGSDKVEGVPFYIKKQVLTHETIWALTNYRVSVHYSIVDVTEKGKVLEANELGSTLIPSTLIGSEEMRSLRRSVIDLSTSHTILMRGAAKGFGKIEEQIDRLHLAAQTEFEKDGNYGSPNQERLSLVSNRIKRTMEADPTKYYINGRAPLFGSGTGNFELTPDMTLTKADSTVEDKTAETLLGIFPLTEFFTKQWALEATGAELPEVRAQMRATNYFQVVQAAKAGEANLVLEIKVVPDVKTYHLAKRLDEKTTFGTPLSVADAYRAVDNIEMEIKKEGEPAPKLPENKSAISFEGSVKLPEAKK